MTETAGTRGQAGAFPAAQLITALAKCSAVGGKGAAHDAEEAGAAGQVLTARSCTRLSSKEYVSVSIQIF